MMGHIIIDTYCKVVFWLFCFQVVKYCFNLVCSNIFNRKTISACVYTDISAGLCNSTANVQIQRFA